MKRFREFAGYAAIVLAGMMLGLIFSHFVVFNAIVPTESMENLISKKDKLYGFRLAYLFEGPERFDIVIFKYPVNESKNYIKRVIGLPGETVEIRDAKIYIDGSDTPLEENYLPEEWVVGCDGYVFQVPEDCYLMLGDNRNISEDARYWAKNALEKGVADSEEEAQEYTYVHADKIEAQAVLKYSPEFEWLTGK